MTECKCPKCGAEISEDKVTRKVKETSKSDVSLADVYDVVHAAATEAGREREFLAKFGNREAYLMSVNIRREN